MLELPHGTAIEAAERRPRILRDLEGVREVGGVWGGVEERRKLHTTRVCTRPARAADVSVSVGLQAHGGADVETQRTSCSSASARLCDLIKVKDLIALKA